MKRNIKLLIEYDGSMYSGWQIQNKQENKTIQGTIQKCIGQLTKEDINLIGCSRTDAGVHAKGFIANFFTCSNIPASKFKYAINNKLPDDIAILNSEEVDENFHSRYNCLGKRYIYNILNRESPSPIMRNYTYHYKHKLNIDDMNEGCKYILGKHDFSAFKSSASNVKDSVRVIEDIRVITQGDFVTIQVTGNGFLYNMVRIIVGTLLDVGIGKKSPIDIKYIIESKDRNKAGKTVPAQGLYLDKVFY